MTGPGWELSQGSTIVTCHVYLKRTHYASTVVASFITSLVLILLSVLTVYYLNAPGDYN